MGDAQKTMHRADIIALLRKKGSGICRVATDLQVHPGTVSSVVGGNDSSQRIQSHVAQLTGKSVDALWPKKPRRNRKRARRAS